MEPSKLNLRKLQKNETIPFHLLLLADETKSAIEKYIYDSDIYVLNFQGGADPIAVFALLRISENEIELKNIAVSEPFQGTGIGRFLLHKATELARADNYKTLIVGTSANGHREIRFYENNGFIKYAVKKDFFILHYDRPIIENGIPLTDMVMLKKELQ